jgi:transposase
MSSVTIAVDLAKSVFQLVVAEESGRIPARERLTRSQFLRFWENRASCRVLMEACGSAHFWGRFLQSRGFDVVLLPSHSATPYVQRGKTDERDAEGLLEAVKSPWYIRSPSRAAISRPSSPCTGRVSSGRAPEPLASMPCADKSDQKLNVDLLQ